MKICADAEICPRPYPARYIRTNLYPATHCREILHHVIYILIYTYTYLHRCGNNNCQSIRGASGYFKRDSGKRFFGKALLPVEL